MLSILPTRKASLPCFLLRKIWIRHIRLICQVCLTGCNTICTLMSTMFSKRKIRPRFCFGRYQCGKCFNCSKEKITSGTMAVRYGSGPDDLIFTAPWSPDINLSGSGTLNFTLYSSNLEWFPICCSAVYVNSRSNLNLNVNSE